MINVGDVIYNKTYGYGEVLYISETYDYLIAWDNPHDDLVELELGKYFGVHKIDEST